ncbi:MAG: saccharopine dehydrogenase [Pseudomonadota bacterium]
MTHLWVRAEERDNESRVGLTPVGARRLIAGGMTVTVEESPARAIPIDDYRAVGCATAPLGSWRRAPAEVTVFGLKELPEDDLPLIHNHIMFGHAYKGQPAGQALLRRFRAGGGTLYDLEYLVDEAGRRVAAFGYWAGYAGAAVSLMAWAAEQAGQKLGPLGAYSGADALLDDLQTRFAGKNLPDVIIIGALGRVGTGAGDLCDELGLKVTRWDMAETAHGGPFPEVLAHGVFLNCILAMPGVPVFVPASAAVAPRALRVIGDIACDPASDYSPIKVYGRTTSWEDPVLRVADAPPLDVMAIDNLPSMLPRESSEDYARQLLPTLETVGDLGSGVWARARAKFDRAVAGLEDEG